MYLHNFVISDSTNDNQITVSKITLFENDRFQMEYLSAVASEQCLKVNTNYDESLQ